MMMTHLVRRTVSFQLFYLLDNSFLPASAGFKASMVRLDEIFPHIYQLAVSGKTQKPFEGTDCVSNRTLCL